VTLPDVLLATAETVLAVAWAALVLAVCVAWLVAMRGVMRWAWRAYRGVRS